MNITFGPGAFFSTEIVEFYDAIREAFGDIEAAFDKLLGFGTLHEMEEVASLTVPGYCPTPREIEVAGWKDAASLARSRMAARAQAFARQMMQQKARQAMKRRKLKHADGYFPDWEGGCVR